MTTPKLKLSSLLDERPMASQLKVLSFIKGSDGTFSEAGCTGVHAADSPYIQKKEDSDKDRFFVFGFDVGRYLLEHNLLEFPDPNEREALAYSQAFTAWCESNYYKAGGPYYEAIREAFIKAFVGNKGIIFSSTSYRLYC
jgi:hypothetical protein